MWAASFPCLSSTVYSPLPVLFTISIKCSSRLGSSASPGPICIGIRVQQTVTHTVVCEDVAPGGGCSSLRPHSLGTRRENHRGPGLVPAPEPIGIAHRLLVPCRFDFVHLLCYCRRNSSSLFLQFFLSDTGYLTPTQHYGPH